MPVRVYDISKKLGIENKDIIAKAKALGIAAAKVPSSYMDKISAEYLEEELIKDRPELAARLAKPVAAPRPPVVEEKVVIISAPPPPPQVRIQDIAAKLELPAEEVLLITKEFGIPLGRISGCVDESVEPELTKLLLDGSVPEKRLQDVEKGGKSLKLRGFLFKNEWISRIGQCKHLEDLNLADTGLSVLPDAFAKLENLSNFNLTGNNLKELPKWLQNLSRLRALYLQGNSALGLPQEILGGASTDAEPAKPREILDYYFRLQTGGKRPLNEAKLILLGRGEVGKTSLVNRLIHDQFTDTTMTCGISITQWKVNVEKEAVRLHVWDFGGQEIQHATHQFFLTERSLYLVVLNGRAGAEDEDAEYWLKFIKTYGGGSPTIVILNKFRVQPFEVNEMGLKEKYPFVLEFIQTDCQADTGIVELREQIKMALGTMDHIRVAFPAEWFQIKERLSEMKTPFISFQEYRNICESKSERDSEAQETLAVFLNALGIALNFRQDARLRDETVLNPHWITKGVYRIITSPLLSEAKGELWLDRLGEILPEEEYPRHMHLFLIELMRKFELCFTYHDDHLSRRYLIPELLGKKQPVFNEAFPPEFSFNFRYDYRILPEGLLARFITRTHVMSAPAERWRTGVVLQWEGARALVKADKQERQITIRVLGEVEKRRRLLAVIRENFDHIHSEMKEFRPVEWIALENNPNEWVKQQDFETFYKKNVEHIQMAVGSEVFSVNVANVLQTSDIAGAKSLTPAGEHSKPRPIKTFLSYAHADEKWRAKIASNLNILQREGLLKIWCDLEIKPGNKWDEEIKIKLEEAELYILLMSTAFLDSEYVHKVELPIAQARENAKKARLVPVVLRKCSWKRYLGEIQALPTGGRAVKTWRDRDDAFFDVEEGLRKTILEMHKTMEFA